MTTTFEKIGSRAIPALQATVEEYISPRTGARHIHLASDQGEKVFLVAFPTVPDVSDGRAHILEHLSLCGSQRYPVRDPFFSMMRRSTATFMNAFTYADRTVYPFSSTDSKDFYNLLDVYLDATFFPNLDYLNFLQEGWRYVLKDGKLGYQGVVFNEMKGAFNDPIRALYSGIENTLLAGTTYEVESGGDPLVIPELTHQMLKDFHASHYHPSQAVFMTAGDISAEAVQQQIEDKVLSKLPSVTAPRMLPELAAAWPAPKSNEVRIPSQTAKPDEYGVQLTWLMGESSDIDTFFNTYLLSSGLLGDSSSPVMKAMESAGFGRPSALNGQDNGPRQMIFHLGMEGLTEPQIEEARTRIWAALEHAAEEGVPTESLQAALRDVRYSQRDTASGRMPNALSRLLNALPIAMRDGDVFLAFDNEAHLVKLEQAIADPAYFKGLVRKLLDNPTRLTTRVVPDADYFKKRDAVEEARLENLTRALTDAERARIESESAALEHHQQLPSNSDVLPRIRPADVSAEPRSSLPLPEPVLQEAGGLVLPFEIASNGLSYVRVNYDVSGFAVEDWPWLRLWADLVTQLGVGDMDYEEADAWRQRMAPSYDVSFDATQHPGGDMSLEVWLAASGLREEHANIAELVSRSLAEARFDEHERLAFLIDSQVQDRINGLAQSGNRYAMLSATAPLSALRRFEDIISGAATLPFQGELLELCKTPEGLAQIAGRLNALHQRVIAITPTVLAAGAGNDGEALGALLKLPASQAAVPTVAQKLDGVALENAALHAVSQVNHCVVAYRAPMLQEDGAAALAVAAELMTNQLLHVALREKGGAYGGNAGYNGGTGTFLMASYRDPRLAETYDDFNTAIDQLLTGEFSQEMLEEAIICVIKGMDKPNSPYDQVLHAWGLKRRGIDQALRQRFRTEVLNCTLDQIRAAVRTWLKDGEPSRAAFVGDLTRDLAGLREVDLLALTQKAQ
ncbi:MAG: insulinase family protein [Duganella sp.]